MEERTESDEEEEDEAQEGMRLSDQSERDCKDRTDEAEYHEAAMGGRRWHRIGRKKMK